MASKEGKVVMIPKSLSTELNKIFSHQQLEERKISEGRYSFVELEHQRDKDLIQSLGIGVDELGPWKVIFLWETMSHLEIGGYLVVDNLAMGKPALGGTRLIPTVSVREVASLARGMTLKNAAADLPFGGGKSGIIAMQNMNPEERQEVIAHFAQMINRYVEVYNPGPDVGTNDEDMKTFAIYNGLNNVVSKTVDMGGNRIDILGAAAGGAVVAVDEIFSQLYKLRELPQFKKHPLRTLDQATLMIQGFGAVGFNVAKLLAEGKLLTKSQTAPRLIAVSDKDGFIFREDGLDIYELLRLKTPEHIISSRYYRHRKEHNYNEDFKFCNVASDMLKESAHVLIPATPIPNYIGVDGTHTPCVTVDQCGEFMIIVEAANTLSVEKDRIEERHRLEKILFHKRGVFIATDYLVNSGGVIFAAYEKLLPTPKELDIPQAIRGQRDKVQQWLDEHQEKFAELAEQRRKLAEQKRDQVIRENITMFISHLVKNPDMLPYQVAEQISLERIIHQDRFVKDVMHIEFATATPEMSVGEIAQLLVKENVDFVPLIDAGKHLIGVVTDWDITRFVTTGQDKQTPVEKIMTSRQKVAVAFPQDSIINTVKTLQSQKCSAMPVVDEQDIVVGMISSDLLVQRTLLRLLQK